MRALSKIRESKDFKDLRKVSVVIFAAPVAITALFALVLLISNYLWAQPEQMGYRATPLMNIEVLSAIGLSWSQLVSYMQSALFVSLAYNFLLLAIVGRLVRFLRFIDTLEN